MYLYVFGGHFQHFNGSRSYVKMPDDIGENMVPFATTTSTILAYTNQMPLFLIIHDEKKLKACFEGYKNRY